MDPFLSYFAGFFDGEGSIGIYPNGSGRGRTLRVQLTQNASPACAVLLSECRTRWGGSISFMNRGGKRPAWIWQASAATGAAVIRDIRPWLRLKGKEADIALVYWNERATVSRDIGGRWTPFTEAEQDIGLRAEAALKALKRLEQGDPARMLADAADRVEVRQVLRQILDVKGS